jgi:hypothetical protein
MPTEQEIAAEVRRRPIGAVIVDSCQDLAILPCHPLWRDLQKAIMSHGGSYIRLMLVRQPPRASVSDRKSPGLLGLIVLARPSVSDYVAF